MPANNKLQRITSGEGLPMRKIVTIILTLMTAPAIAQEPGVETFQYGTSTMHGIRELPQANVVGTYLYEGKGEPRVELRADGSGCWANHQRECMPLKWWIEAYADGRPRGNIGPTGSVHTLILKFDDAANGAVGPYNAFELKVFNDERKILIADEREKPF